MNWILLYLYICNHPDHWLSTTHFGLEWHGNCFIYACHVIFKTIFVVSSVELLDTHISLFSMNLYGNKNKTNILAMFLMHELLMWYFGLAYQLSRWKFQIHLAINGKDIFFQGTDHIPLCSSEKSCTCSKNATVTVLSAIYPDSKVHEANTGPTLVLSAPDGPHVGPMNFAIREYHLLVWSEIFTPWKDITFDTSRVTFKAGILTHMYVVHLVWIQNSEWKIVCILWHDGLGFCGLLLLFFVCFVCFVVCVNIFKTFLHTQLYISQVLCTSKFLRRTVLPPRSTQLGNFLIIPDQ